MKIEIKVNVKNFNGGPKVKVAIDEEILFCEQLSKQGVKLITIDSNKSLPCKLSIQHYGKNMKTDTKVDTHGNIVSDKALIIQSVKINEVILTDEIFLFTFTKDDDTIIKNTNYLGYNGKFMIDINRDNLHSWYNGLQNSLVSEEETFSYDQFKKEIFGE